MQELQCDDFFIPTFLLKLLPKAKIERRETKIEDFLKDIQGWFEYFPGDECAESAPHQLRSQTE